MGDTGFQDAVTDAVATAFAPPKVPSIDALRGLYNMTSPGDAPRYLTVRMLAFSNVPNELLKHVSEELAQDVLRHSSQAATITESTMCAAARCAFHSHGAAEQCYRKKYGFVKTAPV